MGKQNWSGMEIDRKQTIPGKHSCCKNELGSPYQIPTSLVTARKRSFGQGNIFRSVFQEFCPQGGSRPGGRAWSWGVWSWGVSGPGGLLPGGCLVETPPGRLLLRAVRMLLECILVTYFIYTFINMFTIYTAFQIFFRNIQY